jgi:type VI secretion system secreted protein VgrG
MNTATNTWNSVTAASPGYTSISAVLDGQTLTPGNYKTGAASLNGGGALTFNGAGNYIIYTASSLTTGSSGTPVMTLAGGATAANILWVVTSAATINSGFSGTFQGNVISSAALTVTSGGVINGSLAAIAAGLTLSATTTVNGTPSGPANYTITSGSSGVNSAVIVQGTGASTLELGIPNGGTEVGGSGGSSDSGAIKEILIFGSTSSTGVSGQIVPAEVDLIYNGSNELVQTVAYMGNDILTTNIIYNSDGSVNSIQESVNF